MLERVCDFLGLRLWWVVVVYGRETYFQLIKGAQTRKILHCFSSRLKGGKTFEHCHWSDSSERRQQRIYFTGTKPGYERWSLCWKDRAHVCAHRWNDSRRSDKASHTCQVSWIPRANTYHLGLRASQRQQTDSKNQTLTLRPKTSNLQ